jgi:hypothetical protein
MNGSFNSNGLSTSAFFESGTTTSYGNMSDPVSYSGTDVISLSASLSGLTPNTTYHYRVVAFNSAGTSRGGDITFKTTATQVAAGYVVQGGLTWMPTNDSWESWEYANAYCSTATINGQTGWRLPDVYELTYLYTSGALNGQGWTLNFTWSSTPIPPAFLYRPSDGYYTVNLNNGGWAGIGAYGAAVTCVR